MEAAVIERNKTAARVNKPEQVMGQALQSPYSAMRSLTKSSLYRFMQYFWDVYSQDEFQPNWHIEYIANEVQAVIQRAAMGLPKKYDLLINVPPGTTKTATASVMAPVWGSVNWYWMRFITGSYTSPLSLESAEYSRDIIRSEKFQALFPEIGIKQDKDTKSNFKVIKREWVNVGHAPRIKQGGGRFSTSVTGSVTGFHGHVIIIDDPIDPQRAISEAKLAEVRYFLDNTLPFRKVDKNVTPIIMIMQRLAQNDPTGHMLEMYGDGIKHICLPGEIKNYRHMVKPADMVKNYKDQLLDPVRLNWEVLNNYLKLGQYTYGGQIGQDPVPLGGGMFKTDHFAVINTLPHESRIAEVVRYWDKAGTEGDGTWTVGCKMIKLNDGKYVVAHIKRGRWSSEERERIIKETAEADGTNCKIYIEQEPGSGGKESAESTIRNLAGFSVYRDLPTGKKINRADPYSVQVNEGNVQLLQADWNKYYIDELKFFPFSTYKDQVDASSGAFQKLVGRRDVKIYRRG